MILGCPLQKPFTLNLAGPMISTVAESGSFQEIWRPGTSTKMGDKAERSLYKNLPEHRHRVQEKKTHVKKQREPRQEEDVIVRRWEAPDRDAHWTRPQRDRPWDSRRERSGNFQSFLRMALETLLGSCRRKRGTHHTSTEHVQTSKTFMSWHRHSLPVRPFLLVRADRGVRV
ncbi:unnamed protein product [Ranitomeya imitator]|uniref:Uncharacterized protein n=1 Tax=Ranitomeya imitator TaxID=111125 RepID=A0ABN9L0A3_9NEOB|nr:unnamed protein product [Ranitomeya imitator]